MKPAIVTVMRTLEAHHPRCPIVRSITQRSPKNALIARITCTTCKNFAWNGTATEQPIVLPTGEVHHPNCPKARA